MNRDLPPVVRDILGAVPPAGQGIHSYLFRCARNLHAHRSPDQIVDILAAQTESCGRHVPRGEIEDAVRNSESVAWTPDGRSMGTTPPKKWPDINRERRARITKSKVTLRDLFLASPVELTSGFDAEAAVDILFPGNPLICVAPSADSPITRAREELRGELNDLALIVPSPMSAPTGITLDGRESARCLANVGPRKYIIVESDSGTTTEQACAIHHLADFAPLACVVHSGNKSIHGWFRASADEEVTRKFFSYAVSLGADAATWTRCQFVRMPQGQRTPGITQAIWYLNGEVP